MSEKTEDTRSGERMMTYPEHLRAGKVLDQASRVDKASLEVHRFLMNLYHEVATGQPLTAAAWEAFEKAVSDLEDEAHGVLLCLEEYYQAGEAYWADPEDSPPGMPS